jgi:hypothetical protein
MICKIDASEDKLACDIKLDNNYVILKSPFFSCRRQLSKNTLLSLQVLKKKKERFIQDSTKDNESLNPD